MVRQRWLVLGLLLTFASLAYTDDKPQRLSEREIKGLVDRLISQNPKLITRAEDKSLQWPSYRRPPGFDWDKQEPVREARSKLRQLGPQAFPFLIERWGDNSYCMTTAHRLSGGCHNETVGYVCQAILFDQLQPYGYWPEVDEDPRGKPKRPSYPAEFLGSEKAARQWWQKNKDKTLYQMQLEILDWVIAQEAERPGDFTDKERRELQGIRKELVDSGKPLPAGNYDAVDPVEDVK